MDSLIILLVIWFVIDILGGNKKRQQQNQQKKSVEDMRRAMQESQSWLEKQSLKDEIEQEQLRDLQESQRAQRQVDNNRRKIQGKTVIFGDLGDFIREFKDLMDVDSVPEPKARTEQPQPEPVREQPVFSEMSSEDIARRKRELAEKRRRRLSAKQAQPVPVAAEPVGCEYCSGELEVERTISTRAEAAKPVVLATRPVRDVATACRDLQLNELQQAVVWAEVLDKPLALRRRR